MYLKSKYCVHSNEHKLVESFSNNTAKREVISLELVASLIGDNFTCTETENLIQVKEKNSLRAKERILVKKKLIKIGFNVATYTFDKSKGGMLEIDIFIEELRAHIEGLKRSLKSIYSPEKNWFGQGESGFEMAKAYLRRSFKEDKRKFKTLKKISKKIKKRNKKFKKKQTNWITEKYSGRYEVLEATNNGNITYTTLRCTEHKNILTKRNLTVETLAKIDCKGCKEERVNNNSKMLKLKKEKKKKREKKLQRELEKIYLNFEKGLPYKIAKDAKNVIYKCYNNKTGFCYIGMTTTGLEERKKGHLAGYNSFVNYYLLKAKDLTWSVVYTSPYKDDKEAREDLIIKEKLFIKKEDSFFNGYNRTNGSIRKNRFGYVALTV